MTQQSKIKIKTKTDTTMETSLGQAVLNAVKTKFTVTKETVTEKTDWVLETPLRCAGAGLVLVLLALVMKILAFVATILFWPLFILGGIATFVCGVIAFLQFMDGQ